MATATTTDTRSSVPASHIHTPENVRGLDPEHVDALAGSIELQGVLVPVVVRPADDGFELVAGFHRLAAARKLGLKEIPVVLRDADQEDADRAVENIARKALSPYEEARAVKAMLDRGLSADGAAQALGWPKARVTARVKILALPESAQDMLGTGTIALSAVDHLLRIGQVSPVLLGALLDFLADGNEWAAERLAREPGWVLECAIRQGDSKVFAAHLNQVDAHELAELRLGKKTDRLLEEAAGLHKQIDRYAYGSPAVRFSEQEVDQARAAGVVIEFERAAPIIVDRGIYRELAKQAIARTVQQLHEKAAAHAAEKKARRRSGEQPQDVVADARREEQRQIRELAEQAHGINLDLGAGLLNGLASVDAADMDVARFFVYALLGSDYDSSPYTQAGERVAKLTVSGIRLVIDEFRTDATKTLKDGSRGKLRIDYGEPRDPKQPVAWLWKFIDGAKTAGELYGRALVVIAAEQYASRLVVPSSQQSHPTAWSSHKDQAAKALKKLAGPHLPASLAQLENAVKRAHREYASTERHAQEQAGREPNPDAESDGIDDLVDEAPRGDDLHQGLEADDVS